MGSKKLGSVILASALFAGGCSSTGAGGTAGTSGTTGASGTTGSGGIQPPGRGRYDRKRRLGNGRLRDGNGRLRNGDGNGRLRGGNGRLRDGNGGITTGTAGTGTPGAGGSSGGATAGSGGAGASGTAGRGGASGTGGRGGSGSGGTTGTGGSSGGVTVNLDAKRQTIEGFGLNTALSSATPNWDTFYSTTGNGLGLSIVRVAMKSNGSLSGAVPPSSYNAKVIGSPWTAAANCKDNNSTTKGGHLLNDCYDSWSTAIANFAKNNNLYAMGAANEPDFASCGSSIGPPCNGDYDTMVFTANEMVNFVKVLGPKLKAASGQAHRARTIGVGPPLEQCFGHGLDRRRPSEQLGPAEVRMLPNSPTTTGCASTCATGNGYDYGHWLAKDATAWGLIDIIGTHEYDSQKAEAWPADVDGGKRTKTVYADRGVRRVCTGRNGAVERHQ